ncbi:MAG: CXXX repeat peptide modification system protein [Bacteroidales bacterium]
MTGKRLIGKVTQQERDEIQLLHERKNGLTELIKSINLADHEILYEKIVRDMGETSAKFQKWWDAKSLQYGWDNIEGYSWEISFENCEIYLVKK